MSQNLSDQDYEALSAYLDGELPQSDRTLFELRLTAEPALRRELAALTEVRSLVRNLPLRAAPRSYVLDEVTARKLRQPLRLLGFPATAAFSALSTAAAVILLLLAGVIFLNTNSASQRPSSVAVVPTNALSSTLQVVPQIIPQQSSIPALQPTTLDTVEQMQALIPLITLTDTAVHNQLPQDTTGAANAALSAAPAAAAPPLEDGIVASTEAESDAFSIQAHTATPAPEILRQAEESAALDSAGGIALAESTEVATPVLVPEPLVANGAIEAVPTMVALTPTLAPTHPPTAAPSVTPTVVPIKSPAVPLSPTIVITALILAAAGLLIFAAAATWMRRENRL